MKATTPKVALFDIENSPLLGYAWGVRETDIIEKVKDSYLLCFSIKWLGENRVETYALPDFPLYKKEPENDKALVTKLWEFMNDADVIIAQNGDQFDIKKSNTRFITHRLPPPDPYKTVDTLKLARRYFGFASNKLDNIAKDLKEGRKLPHTGKQLWLDCMAGDEKAWTLMKRYNKQDVLLLEKIYLRFRPWAANHPDLRVYDKLNGCPRCRSQNIRPHGTQLKGNKIHKSFECKDCRARFPGERV